MQQVKQPYIIDQYPEDQGEEYVDEEDLPGYQGEEDQEYEEDQMQTLYVFDYNPEEPLFHLPRLNKDQWIAALMGLLALAMLVGACFIPSGQVYTVTTISVPAHFSTHVYTAYVPITPTGQHSYKAVQASGTITFFNGGFLAQQIPANFILTTKDGIEIATDQAVIIPANNPPSNGEASVSAHALLAGKQGNIPAYAIDQTYGSDIFVKNLAAFSGGKDAYTTTYATSEDKAKALDDARAQLITLKPLALESKPCTETASQHDLNLSVSWTCFFVTYQAPKGVQILAAHVQGDKVILKIRIEARVVTTHFAK